MDFQLIPTPSLYFQVALNLGETALLSLFLPSTLNSRRVNCSEGLILAYSPYFTMIDSVTQCRFLNDVRPV